MWGSIIGLTKTVINKVPDGFTKIAGVFTKNKEEESKRIHKILELTTTQGHEVELANLAHRQANFKNRLYQITAGSFVLLFVILILSPLIKQLSFIPGMNDILSDYLEIYTGIGNTVIMTVLGSILGVSGITKIVSNSQMKGLVNSVRASNEKIKVEKEKKDAVVKVAEIKANGGAYTFADCFGRTMNHEGGYANDPDDSGGETYKGIARKFHPKWAGWIKIDEQKKYTPAQGAALNAQLKENFILQDEVKDFYKQEFWVKAGCDKISSGIVRCELFDSSVNCGIRQAVKFLQRAVNNCSKGVNNIPLEADGAFGDATLMALESLLPRYAKAVHKSMNGEQYQHYESLCMKNPSQWKFFRGWMARV